MKGEKRRRKKFHLIKCEHVYRNKVKKESCSSCFFFWLYALNSNSFAFLLSFLIEPLFSLLLNIIQLFFVYFCRFSLLPFQLNSLSLLLSFFIDQRFSKASTLNENICIWFTFEWLILWTLKWIIKIAFYFIKIAETQTDSSYQISTRYPSIVSRNIKSVLHLRDRIAVRVFEAHASNAPPVRNL
jgi:hypothetical protein